MNRITAIANAAMINIHTMTIAIMVVVDISSSGEGFPSISLFSSLVVTPQP